MSMPGSPAAVARKRVIAYVDGFNLYYGLRQSGWRRYLWLDLPALAASLLRPDQELVLTKYFTSRIVHPDSKRKRQSTYLEALEAHGGAKLTMYFGHYQLDPWTCKSCGAIEQVPSEKKTDVNIAVEIMTDAFRDAFDAALLVTADSDLVPPVLAVKRLFSTKRIVVAFPPSRHSAELKREAHASFPIGRARFSKTQLPETVAKPGGTYLSRPQKWAGPSTRFGRLLDAALESQE